MNTLRQDHPERKPRPIIDLTDGRSFLAHYKSACEAIMLANDPPRLCLAGSEVRYIVTGYLGGVDPHAQARLPRGLYARASCVATRDMPLPEFHNYLRLICDWRLPVDDREFRALMLMLYVGPHAPGVPFLELVDHEEVPADAHCN